MFVALNFFLFYAAGRKTLIFPTIMEEEEYERCILAHLICPLDLDVHVPACESLECLEIDGNFLAYLLEYMSFGTALKQLTISKCPGLDLQLHLMELASLESLESNGCFFLSCSIRDYFSCHS